MKNVLERTRRFRFPEDREWWDARTIPEHVPDYRIERNLDHAAEYGVTFEPILKRMVKLIVANFDPIQVWLYGSMARGDGNEHSDVDLMVVMPNGTSSKKSIDVRLVVTHSMLPKDIVVSTPETWGEHIDDVGSVVYTVSREGVMLYG